MMGAAILTVLSGLGLYWRDSAGFVGTWVRSGTALVFSLGALLGLGAVGLGMGVAAPVGKRLGVLAAAVQAEGGPTADEAAEMQRLQPRLARRPVACLNTYLRAIYHEAAPRGYRFDRRKLGRTPGHHQIAVTTGQLAFEWCHLKRKLRARSPAAYRALRSERGPAAHPLFIVADGPVSAWERAAGRRRQPSD